MCTNPSWWTPTSTKAPNPATFVTTPSRTMPCVRSSNFREGVEKLEDLKPGMVLEGVVTNVGALGAFVDVGVHQDGLVHISAMANAYVKDPRKIAKPGDVVRVKVLEVDPKRRRISLTMRLD